MVCVLPFDLLDDFREIVNVYGDKITEIVEDLVHRLLEVRRRLRGPKHFVPLVQVPVTVKASFFFVLFTDCRLRSAFNIERGDILSSLKAIVHQFFIGVVVELIP